ncbi:MAG: hypothetical protein WCI27_04490 [Candidatus Omnitrophota bacterium]
MITYHIVKKPRVEPKVFERRQDKDEPHVMEKLSEPFFPPPKIREMSTQESRGQFSSQDVKGVMDGADVFERKPEQFMGAKVTKAVSVPMLKSERINTPSYANYYQIVRNRIRERAYSNYTKLSVGEIFVTFIIKSDGTLSGLQILDDKSTANNFLRDVGLKSVREAAPFPAFPRDLVYPELTFNVSISFQYREE